MHNQNHPPPLPLHRRWVRRRAWPNRVFAVVYASAIAALVFRHTTHLLTSHSTLVSLTMLLADVILAFMWFTHQGFRMNPVRRKTFPENLPEDGTGFPAMDVFICTADPEKEPPMVAVNTALSTLAFDYPTEKLSVYLSDDGGSKVTLFAFVEAAKFAKEWIPYCKENRIMDRSPEAYFSSDYACFPRTHEIKVMYESMKAKVEKGDINNVYEETNVFNQWDANFTRQNHPTVIKVLLDGTEESDVLGHAVPNLIYLRVSEAMTNAPIILTLDCDMYSNHPKTPLKALCYFLDPSTDSNKIAFVQFPQIFQGIKEDDIYGAEFKFIFQINMAGFDGLLGPSHVGTGCFFRRQVFYGGPSSGTLEQTQTQSIRSNKVLDRCHEVASCDFEAQTKWGYELGYRYGSMIEDFNTGYHLHCNGWRSVFCLPKRPAFVGTAPRNLHDLLNQTQRWSMGLLDMNFSKYSPLNHGLKHLTFFQSMCYIHYIFWPIWCIPLLIYSLLPQLALIHSFPIFPKVSDPWFLLYGLLFVGAYGQDFLEYKLGGGTTRGWYNNQRAWMIRSLSSYTFAIIEYTSTKLWASPAVFNVTSKVVDQEASTRYENGMMEFGVESLFFYPISVAALHNLIALIFGVVGVLKHGGLEDLFMQFLLVGFGVVNSWPIYQAMVFRSDPGKMPLKITLTSVAIASMLNLVAPFAF
ncbi:hypothetical protein OSB04_022642 [Centaurea solstitialis]|uniref:Cellulose synthase-like protein G3 n=1 Tax=Centaurea solstitialis TaxID=347529 RepID=A0AA38WHG1_9ASTR|nr:hypothetical protein OSB04_022642 [Centaurea solstitialis]